MSDDSIFFFYSRNDDFDIRFLVFGVQPLDIPLGVAQFPLEFRNFEIFAIRAHCAFVDGHQGARDVSPQLLVFVGEEL